MNWTHPVAALGLCLLTGAALADEQLAARRNCLNCHGVQERKIRLYPSFKEVARKYAGQPAAEQALVQKVLAGGKGSFGQLYMPAQKGIVSETEAKQLVKWVLSQPTTAP